MKLPVTLALLAAVGALVWTTNSAFTEDEKAKPLSVAEMEGKMFQSGAPCPGHELLKKFIGTWDTSGAAYSSMGEFPISGEAIFKSIMDGRFLATSYESPPGPMGVIKGAGHMGFNRMTNEYENIWFMSMGTGIDKTTGTYNEKTKTITLLGNKQMFNNEVWPMRVTMTFESDDKITELHYMTPKVTGKEQLGAKMVYTRKKVAAKAPTTGK